MKIACIHGYFKFLEERPGEISQFSNLFGLELARSGDHFTFADLVDAPRYSIAGQTYLGAPATETFEGEPWEVMRENGLVYDFSQGLVVPIAAIVRSAPISQAGFYRVSNGMIVPGSVTEDGGRVTDYAAFYIPEIPGFKYSEVEYE